MLYGIVRNSEDPVTQPPDKISKIPSICYVTFNCAVYVISLSSLASKLRDEMEVTNRRQPLINVAKF